MMTELIQHNGSARLAERVTTLPSIEVLPSGDVLLANFQVSHTAALSKGMPDYKEAAQWLSMAKTACNYTQKEMAAMTGVAQSTISQYLRWHKKGCPDAGPFVRRVPRSSAGQSNTAADENVVVIDVESTVVDEPQLVDEQESVALITDDTPPAHSVDDIVQWVVEHVASRKDFAQLRDALDDAYDVFPEDDEADADADGDGDEHHEQDIVDPDDPAAERKLKNAELFDGPEHLKRN
jgi:hypothetical protein